MPLNPRERRVVGVLAEKGKTTPEYYPLTVAAIVAGCNQKSNRDPITNYDQDDVEETLQSLRKKGATILVESSSGRVPRWKHTLYEWLKVSKAELAVIIELLLRGPQTEGELRAHASRMEPFPDLAALQTVLEALSPRGLVVYLVAAGPEARRHADPRALSPRGAREGPPRLRRPATAGGDDDAPSRISTARGELAAAGQPPAWAAEIAAVRSDVDDLRKGLETLAAELRELKTALGA